MSKLLSVLNQTIDYIAEGSIEAFSPAKDSYPSTGLQSFSGEPFDATAERYAD